MPFGPANEWLLDSDRAPTSTPVFFIAVAKRPSSRLYDNKFYCRRKDVLSAAEQLPHLGAVTHGDTHAVFGVMATAEAALEAAGRADIIVLSAADLLGPDLAVRMLAMETTTPEDRERRRDWYGDWDRRQERWLVLRNIANLIEAVPAA